LVFKLKADRFAGGLTQIVRNTVPIFFTIFVVRIAQLIHLIACRIAVGPHEGRKAFRLQTVPTGLRWCN
jgi:hypothetical protein